MAVAVAAGQHLSVTYDVLLPNKQFWRERGFASEQRKSRITVDTSSCATFGMQLSFKMCTVFTNYPRLYHAE